MSGGSDKAVHVWDLSDPAAPARVLTGHTATVWSVAFSPDGHSVASGSADGTTRIWDLRQANPNPSVLGQLTRAATTTRDRPCFSDLILAAHPNDIYSVTFDKDGSELATGSADGTIRLWRLNNLSAPFRVLTGHTDYVCSVKFSPDGMTLASGSGDNSIRIWNLRKPGTASTILSGHSGNVLAVDFSPDGTRLASGSEDKTIRIWDTYAPGSGSQVFTGPHGMVTSVAFSPDGRLLASGDTDKTIWLWSQPDKLMDVICKVVWRNLTMDEWNLFVGKGIPYERTCPNLPPGEGAPANAR